MPSISKFGFYNIHVFKKKRRKKIKQIKKGKSREQYAKIHLLHPCTTHFIQLKKTQTIPLFRHVIVEIFE